MPLPTAPDGVTLRSVAALRYTTRFCSSTWTIFGLKLAGFVVVDRAVGENDDHVAVGRQPGGGAVEHHRARAGGGLDHVGDQPLGVREIQHVDLFAGQQIGGLDQVRSMAMLPS